MFEDIGIAQKERLEYDDEDLNRIGILEPSIDYFDENGSALNS